MVVVLDCVGACRDRIRRGGGGGHLEVFWLLACPFAELARGEFGLLEARDGRAVLRPSDLQQARVLDHLRRKVRPIVVPGQRLRPQEIEGGLSDHEALVSRLHHDFTAENEVEGVGLDASPVQNRIVKTVVLLLTIPYLTTLTIVAVVVTLLHYLVIILLNTIDQWRIGWFRLRLNQLYLVDIDLLDFRCMVVVAFKIEVFGGCIDELIWVDLDGCVRVGVGVDAEHVSVADQLLENVGPQSIAEKRCNIVRQELLHRLYLVFHELITRLMVLKQR